MTAIDKAAKLREKLTDEQYRVTQNAATERPFSGKYVDHKDDGQLSLCLLRCAVVQLGHQVRFGLRLAEFLAAAGGRRRSDAHGHDARHDAHRSRLCELRCSSWSRFRRRSAAVRSEILH